MSKAGDFSVVIKWSGEEHEIGKDDILETETVYDLKQVIFKKIRVHPDRQKLLGLKLKGKPAPDDTVLAELKLKPKTKLMLIGSREEEIEQASAIPDDIPEVLNDLDVPDDAAIAIECREEFLAKIEKRIKEYKIETINPPRPQKKLLVLDIDYTLFDHRSIAENANQLMRPFLHEFLASAYEDYDIAIWSATGMKWIEVKMRELGVANNPNYKIVFYLCSAAMISVHTAEYGLMNVKPLGVVWGKFPMYTSKNTIMFDDIRRNFLMNPQNGLRIKAFRDASRNRATDRELLKLAKYLRRIAHYEDFSGLDHRHWHSMVRDDE